MPRFALSHAARSDLSAIVKYTVQRWGEQKARAYLDVLYARLRDLAEYPSSGRRRDELAPDLLSIPFESHVIFYVRTNFGVSIVRILHERQDPFRQLR